MNSPRALNPTYAAIYRALAQIPRGRVATYGQIAELAGLPGRARQVGYALHALPDLDLPWHRVVNACGKISLSGPPGECQRDLLIGEGIEFTAAGRIDLARYQFRAEFHGLPSSRAARAPGYRRAKRPRE